MKVVIKPQPFCQSKQFQDFLEQDAFRSLGTDFLAVILRLCQLPCLWFSSALCIELDFNVKKITLRATAITERCFPAQKVIQEISFKEFVCLPNKTLRDDHIRPFAANLVEHTFGMPKTGKAIREEWHNCLIFEAAIEEGYPFPGLDIDVLLFREDWGIESSI